MKIKNFAVLRFLAWVRDVFRIEGPLDEDGVIALIRSDIEFKGAKAWILVTAILIASLGLNTNSTAVVIGAMLISPLMGPIVGVGAAVGIWDVGLLTRSARNLAITVFISLVASTLYFLLTPLGDARSELIARTTPTLLDALIAIFGGIAGGVAAIRQDKSNVIPGVAIATALMPPLCTAGYGIAHLDATFFLGAFYLFFINSVCISAATYAVVRVAGFHKLSILDPIRARKVRTAVSVFVALTLIPSIIIGYGIVQESVFDQRVVRFVEDIRTRYPAASVMVTYKSFSSEQSRLELTMVGQSLDSLQRSQVDSLREAHRLASTTLLLRQAGDARRIGGATDVSATRLLDMYTRTEVALSERTRELDSLRSLVQTASWRNKIMQDVAREAGVLFPSLNTIAISPDIIVWHRDGSMDSMTIAKISWAQRPAPDVVENVQSWLRLRTQDSTLVVQ
jgi:uncharacterized hydrophobic protein (TIGR00271 family)